MNRSYKYRLYPNKAQLQSLDEMLDVYRELYNAALQERLDAWHRNKIRVSWIDQANQLKEIRKIRPDLAKFSYCACQQILRRLHKAFNKYFLFLKAGKRAGPPRFKSKSRFRSVEYVYADAIHVRNRHLYIQGIGSIKVKWHRPIPLNATIKMVIVKRDGGGHWYAVLQVELPDSVPVIHTGPVIGMDLGVTTLAALSTGELIKAPRYFRKTERKLRRQQRRVTRRKFRSCGWYKAQHQVVKTYRHVVSQRKDLSHKLSRRLVKDFSLIAVEKLTIEGLCRSRLAKSIHDAGWSQLLMHLAYKAECAGSQVVKVDPCQTSQVCSGCGTLVHKSLSVRVHHCSECGLTIDRDVNAAINILHRALKSLGRSDEALTWPVTACVASEVPIREVVTPRQPRLPFFC